jgi:HSP90 family molecular chaperone
LIDARTDGLFAPAHARTQDSTAGPATETDTNQPAKPVYNIPAPVVSEEDKTHFDSQVSREFVTPSAYIRFRYERPDEWEATNTQLNIDILR